MHGYTAHSDTARVEIFPHSTISTNNLLSKHFFQFLQRTRRCSWPTQSEPHRFHTYVRGFAEDIFRLPVFNCVLIVPCVRVIQSLTDKLIQTPFKKILCWVSKKISQRPGYTKLRMSVKDFFQISFAANLECCKIYWTHPHSDMRLNTLYPSHASSVGPLGASILSSESSSDSSSSLSA